MKIISSTTESAMIATFLQGELTSKRFGHKIREALQELQADERVITHPAVGDPNEDGLRRKLLQAARGYGSNESWFTGWPKTVDWYAAELSRSELSGVRYIVYDYWIELTKGSLRAGDAVPTIQKGEEVFGVSNQPFLDAATAIAAGAQLPPMILVGTDQNDLVVMEGHLRLTAYVLAGNKAPASIPAIVGLSADFAHWKAYSFAAYDRHRY
jgi:hypothetical protein